MEASWMWARERWEGGSRCFASMRTTRVPTILESSGRSRRIATAPRTIRSMNRPIRAAGRPHCRQGVRDKGGRRRGEERIGKAHSGEAPRWSPGGEGKRGLGCTAAGGRGGRRRWEHVTTD